MGVLTEAGAPDWHPAPPEVHEIGRKVVEHVRAHRSSVTDVALLFAMAHEGIATTCVGMRSVDEVKQNLDLLGRQLDPDLLDAIEELVAPVRNLNWAQGISEYNDPGSVPARR